MQLLQPKPYNPQNPQLMYMGMHFLNNATYSFDADTQEYQKARKKNNCMLWEDRTVMTVNRVEKGDKFLTGYNSKEDNPRWKEWDLPLEDNSCGETLEHDTSPSNKKIKSTTYILSGNQKKKAKILAPSKIIQEKKEKK